MIATCRVFNSTTMEWALGVVGGGPTNANHHKTITAAGGVQQGICCTTTLSGTVHSNMFIRIAGATATYMWQRSGSTACLPMWRLWSHVNSSGGGVTDSYKRCNYLPSSFTLASRYAFPLKRQLTSLWARMTTGEKGCWYVRFVTRTCQTAGTHETRGQRDETGTQRPV